MVFSISLYLLVSKFKQLCSLILSVTINLKIKTMPKPIVYGVVMSPPVRAVLLTANAIGLDFEFKEVNFQEAEHMSEEFRKKNPQHTVPTLEDDGKFIWDSHAIAVYLVQKYGKDEYLYPKDLFKRAQIDQRLHFDSGILFPRMRRIVDGFRKTGKVPEQEIPPIEEAYAFLESFLEKDLYLAGNVVTIADFCCVATITSICMLVPIDSVKYPKVTEWIKRIELLPYYEKSNGEGLKKTAELMEKMLKEHAGN